MGSCSEQIRWEWGSGNTFQATCARESDHLGAHSFKGRSTDKKDFRIEWGESHVLAKIKPKPRTLAAAAEAPIVQAVSRDPSLYGQVSNNQSSYEIDT